jgi:hypothetical protein
MQEMAQLYLQLLHEIGTQLFLSDQELLLQADHLELQLPSPNLA